MLDRLGINPIEIYQDFLFAQRIKSGFNMAAPKIGLICGSLRKGSINKSLEGALAKRLEQAGATAHIIDLGEYELPLFHGDLTTPPNAATLIKAMSGCDGIIIISPEYNGGLPPLLKNVIDWTSTIGREHLDGPIYAIASCSPGPMSGIMVMRQINYILTRLHAELVPVQLGCGNAETAFDKEGNLIAQPAADLADKMIGQLLSRIAQKANG